MDKVRRALENVCFGNLPRKIIMRNYLCINFKVVILKYQGYAHQGLAMGSLFKPSDEIPVNKNTSWCFYTLCLTVLFLLFAIYCLAGSRGTSCFLLTLTVKWYFCNAVLCKVCGRWFNKHIHLVCFWKVASGFLRSLFFYQMPQNLNDNYLKCIMLELLKFISF